MLVVDAANVVGSRPNGWWRDRPRAARDLCSEIRAAIDCGRLDAPVVVVLEGAARPGVDEGEQDGLRIQHAPRSGDDTLAEVVAHNVESGQTVTLVTADRELRGRAEQSGGDVVGPRWLFDRLDPTG